jgi:adenosylhomocysteine nucleosidase
MGRVKVGVIGAMDSEVTSLIEKIQGVNTYEVGTIHANEGVIDGVNVVVVKCGIGKVFAAMCAQALINNFGCTHIINTGVAGALAPELNVGDIVVSTDACEHDLDVTPLGYAPGEHPDLHQVYFQADDHLREVALGAASEFDDVNAFEGRVCSGDQFIASVEQKERITNLFGGMCCEMEGASIAHVCSTNEIPFVVVRAISDKADGSAHVSYPEFEKAAAAHCAKVVLQTLPKITA